MHSNRPSILETIPFDLKDQIIAHLDSPKDLLSFGLASHEWASMIIPIHIEYRELRIRANRPEIWHHLAIRADLSKNIRTVRLMTAADPDGERLPSTFCGTTPHKSLENGLSRVEPIPDMVLALSNMKSLRSFTWIGPDGHPRQLAEDIFDALSHCPILEELRLGEVFTKLDELRPDYSLYKIRNLRKLVLKSMVWAYREVMTMLKNSPGLEELTISYKPSAPAFASCRFPSLRKLHLWPEFDASVAGDNLLSTDDTVLAFINSHPSIQDLRWYPVDQGLPLPLGFLPSLKRIQTHHRLATLLLRDKTLLSERAMESISQISLGFNTMQLLGMINGSQLQELYIWRFENLESISRIAVLFPTIKVLGIPTFGIPSASEDDYTIDDCIDCLAQFPALESLFDTSFWLVIQNLKEERKLEVVKKLVSRCPRLKRINHWSASLRLPVDVVLARTAGKVTWEERVVNTAFM
ncbi:hypothetical protein B0H34DRAFT_800116 [Crassisporium funariophilum]|nr:hypothetical protein B0H34DRAFT_800116 [Crassisporium funariophilum]